MAASAGAWYRVGAVNVTNGNQSIIGVGSNWQNDVIAIAIGDAFTTDAKTWYEVTAVNNDVSITLDRPFEGASADGKDYAILRNTSGTILTRIAGQIAIQFNQKQLFLDELRDWLTSDEEAVNVTDSHGITRAFKTLNKIQALSGTAATKNVGEEIGDVMAFGALGLGKTALTTISQANIDDVSFGRNAESFKVANPIGLPAGVYALIIRRTSAENVTQILHRQDSGVAMYVRSFDAVGGATQWSKVYDDSKLYDQSNIVGTVSQSGGVPTGAIIERGSNSNGEYTKLADGTLICTMTHQVETSQTDTNIYGKTSGEVRKYLSPLLQFPASFSSTPVVSSNPKSNNAMGSLLWLVDSSSFRFTVFSANVQTVVVSTTAIGRWW